MTLHSLVLCLLLSSPLAAGPFLKDVSSEAAMRIEQEADIVVVYNHNKRLDLGINQRSESGMVRLDHTPAELISFFNAQKHKALIVVIFVKNAWAQEKLYESVEELTAYFLDMGYERVVIQQARGFGRETYSDKTKAPK